MTPYIGCDYARARVESLVDGELAMDQQVAVESHVRWCRTCAARIEDLQLIGQSIRRRTAAQHADPELECRLRGAATQVLGRVGVERRQAVLTRLREQLTDLRLVLPAAGATLAVVLAIGVALAVLQWTSVEVRAESLAARIEMMGSPGSELNPLRPDNRGWVEERFGRYLDSNHAGGHSLARAALDSTPIVLATPGPSESSFTLSLVVGRDGRVIDYYILSAAGTEADYEAAVQAAVQQSRFLPAQMPSGRTVAVMQVQMLVFSSVQAPDLGLEALLPPAPLPPVQRGADVSVPHQELPVSSQLRQPGPSPTA